MESKGEGRAFSREEAQWINSAAVWLDNELEQLVNGCGKDNIFYVLLMEKEKIDDKRIKIRGDFVGHEAYTKNPFINPIVIKPRCEDINNSKLNFVSDYSMHPNRTTHASDIDKKPRSQSYWAKVYNRTKDYEKEIPLNGAAAYAKAVQKIINGIDKRHNGSGDSVEEPEMSRALSAYYDLLTSGSFNRYGREKEGNEIIPEEVWVAKNCFFNIAYIDDNNIPELILYNRHDSDHAHGWGQIYTYKDGNIVSVDSPNDISNDTNPDVQLKGYYERTGYYTDFEMWQGYGGMSLVNMDDPNDRIRIEYEPTEDDVQISGYSIGNKKCTEDEYEQRLKDMVGGAKFIPYMFFENTTKNRERIFGVKENLEGSKYVNDTKKTNYYDSFKKINEIGKTFESISKKYELNIHETTDSWEVYSCKGMTFLFGFNGTNYDDDYTHSPVCKNDKCERISGTAKELFGIKQTITIPEFEKQTGWSMDFGNGLDLETSMFTGQSTVVLSPGKDSLYNILLRDVEYGKDGIINPETMIDVEDLTLGKPFKIKSRKEAEKAVVDSGSAKVNLPLDASYSVQCESVSREGYYIKCCTIEDKGTQYEHYSALGMFLVDFNGNISKAYPDW